MPRDLDLASEQATPIGDACQQLALQSRPVEPYRLVLLRHSGDTLSQLLPLRFQGLHAREQRPKLPAGCNRRGKPFQLSLDFLKSRKERRWCGTRSAVIRVTPDGLGDGVVDQVGLKDFFTNHV